MDILCPLKSSMAYADTSGMLDMVYDKLKRLQSILQDDGKELKELKMLESNLSDIRRALGKDEAQQVNKMALSWLKEVKDVVYDIDDVLDEAAIADHTPNKKIENIRMRLKSINDSRWGAAGHSDINIWPTLRMVEAEHSRVDIELKELGSYKKLDIIQGKMISKYYRNTSPAELSSVNIGQRELSSYMEKSQVIIGRDEDKKQIIHFLLNKCNEEDLGVISVVGLGGVGKTTIAQLVFNDEQVSEHFGTKIWVHVSRKFEIKVVIALIIESLTSQKFERSSMDVMEQELLKQIRGKRFLLVLDDVWTEDYQPWHRLGSLLRNGSAKSSKVMVTTRSERVASVMQSDELHSVSGLSNDKCLELFVTISSGLGARNSKWQIIGMDIVKKCNGLPLAVKALGCLFHFKRNENWPQTSLRVIRTSFKDNKDTLSASVPMEESQLRAINDHEIWTQFKDSEDILPALMLSYIHLSPRLKRCFAYCSIFPKGIKIKIKLLIQSWVAEGFVADSSCGSQCVYILISRSLLENATEDGFIIMHDMVHNLAQFVADDECLIIDSTSGRNINDSQNSRYLSLVLDDAATLSTLLILRNGKKLRTFHLINSMSYYKEKKDISQKLLDTIVSNMKLLRTLHLCGLYIKELPASLTELVYLRYLDLSMSDLESLPQTIDILHYLHTLILQHTCLQTLPESIGKLVNLLTLDISYCRHLHSLPNTIGKLVHLENLDLSWTKLQELPPTIGILRNLQTLYLTNCDQLKELPEPFGGLEKLSILKLDSCESLHLLPESTGKLIHLENLDLSWTNIQTLPWSIGKLDHLQTLYLKGCKNLQYLPDSIGYLKSLWYLDLQSTKLRKISTAIRGSIKILNLSYCEELEELPGKIGYFSHLITLKLDGCKRLHTLPPSLGMLFRLEVLDISNINALKRIPNSTFYLPYLKRLHLRNCYGFQELPIYIKNLERLTHLDIDGCHSLTSMPAGIGQLSQLQTLPMYVLGDGENCASLAELGTLMNLQGPLCIKNLHNVKDVAEASAANLREKQRINSLCLEWDFDADWNRQNYQGIDDFENRRKTLIERTGALDGDRARLLEDVARSIQPRQNLPRLQIRGYVGKMLPGWIMDLSNLLELKLESLPRCDNLQVLEKLTFLEILELKRFPFIESLPRLGQLPCLRVLKLYMLPGVKCLGSELYGGAGAFPALHNLELEFMLGLEEWSGNSNDDDGDDFLSRLSTLVVRDCPKLQSLPSTFFLSVEKLTMNEDDELLRNHLKSGAFPNLNDLHVCDCADTDEDESSFLKGIAQGLDSVQNTRKKKEQIRWNHSRFELEMMSLKTLKSIAREIDIKYAVDALKRL